MSTIARVLSGLAGAGLIVDGALHWILYGQSGLHAIAASSLPVVLKSDFQTFWVADVVTLVATGSALVWAGLRPAAASPVIVLLLAAIPAGLGVLNVLNAGVAIASLNMLAATVMAVIAAVLRMASNRTAA
jgi:uncharacterized membrane protein